jgi:Mce-associated membrane protein
MSLTMDVEEDASAEVDETPDTDNTNQTRDKVSRREIVLAVVAAVAIIGMVAFGLLWNGERNEDAAQESMENVANDFLVALFDFDGATINEDFDEIIAFTTGDYEEFANDTFGDDATRQALRENRASSRLEIRDIYVQSFSGDRGTVYAVIDQTIANSRVGPTADTVRIEVEMKKVDGDWKVNGASILEAPVAQAAIDSGIIPGTSPTTPTTAPAG